MRHFIAALALTMAAACTAPAPDTTVLSADDPLASAASEDARREIKMQKTERASSEGNTYDQTCGPVRARFEASNPTAVWDERVALGMEENRAAGIRIDGRATLEHDVLPVPSLPDQPSSSAVCELIMDVSELGIPQNVNAICSDPEFESYARRAMISARFKPAMVANQPTPLKAMRYPMEFCIHD